MRFVNPYEYAQTFNEVSDNCRYLADSLTDGKHDMIIQSLRVTTAPVTATLTHAGMYLSVASGFVVRVFTGSV